MCGKSSIPERIKLRGTELDDHGNVFSERKVCVHDKCHECVMGSKSWSGGALSLLCPLYAIPSQTWNIMFLCRQKKEVTD